MELSLEKLHVENFKGIRELSIDFSPTRTEIRGMNGVGKTSIVDAFCWVLFNQNAAGDAPGTDNFREKPLDELGQVIHNLDTTVELFCTLDGQRFDLKRTQSESWVKKRGNADATFQGNVSRYWINGVETKLAEFKQRIKAIADDDVFRLVGSLSAFNHLEWKKRRAQLLALADSNIDGELLARDEYRPVADAVAERNISVDDLRKVLNDQCKAMKNELKELPVRIDEARKSLHAADEKGYRDAEYMVKESRESIATVDDQLASLRAKAKVTPAKTPRDALEQELRSIKRRLEDENRAERRTLNDQLIRAGEDYDRAARMLEDSGRILNATERKLKELETYVDKLRNQYMEVRREAPVIEDTCPTCGQPMPPEKLEEARSAFDAAKRKRLSDIQTDGKASAAECTKLKEELEHERSEYESLAARVDALDAAKIAARAALDEFVDAPDYASEPRISAIEREIAELNSASDDEVNSGKERDLLERKRELQGIVDKNLAILAARDADTENKVRIRAYESRQQEVGAQLSETEILIGLVEQFITARCGALEQSINSLFPTVRWKLFDVQINGGISDVCTCMIECDGAMVPYSSANTASQINADVEIVNVLSDRYGVKVPLFIDNSERVNTIAATRAQLITLAVSTDLELVVEGDAS